MIKFSKTLTLLLIAVLLFSCKKEESLTPNEDAAKSQQAGIDFLNNGGQVDIGGDNGGNNNSSSVDEFMNATVDGTNESYDSFTYIENGPLLSMSGFDNSTAISFSLTSIPSSGDVIDLSDQMVGSGTYVPGVGISYSSIDGELTIDSVTTAFISGGFYFSAENTTGSDTVVVTLGSFKIAR